MLFFAVAVVDNEIRLLRDLAHGAPLLVEVMRPFIFAKRVTIDIERVLRDRSYWVSTRVVGEETRY